MDDEGLGIAGWLFADLVLVLALVFIAVNWLDDEEDIIEPAAAATETPTPTPTPTPTTTPSPTPTPTPPPTPTATPTQTKACDSASDFSFDQIVLKGMTRGSVDGDLIINTGRVRTSVNKSKEFVVLDEGNLEDVHTATFLKLRYARGFRIALVETYSNSGDGAHIALFDALEDVILGGDGILAYPTVPDDRTGAYLALNTFDVGEVRINLFFVKPPDEDCQ